MFSFFHSSELSLSWCFGMRRDTCTCTHTIKAIQVLQFQLTCSGSRWPFGTPNIIQQSKNQLPSSSIGKSQETLKYNPGMERIHQLPSCGPAPARLLGPPNRAHVLPGPGNPAPAFAWCAATTTWTPSAQLRRCCAPQRKLQPMPCCSRLPCPPQQHLQRCRLRR